MCMNIPRHSAKPLIRDARENTCCTFEPLLVKYTKAANDSHESTKGYINLHGTEKIRKSGTTIVDNGLLPYPATHVVYSKRPSLSVSFPKAILCCVALLILVYVAYGSFDLKVW